VRTGTYPGRPANPKYGHTGATFDLFDKVAVNGPNTHPVFAMLKTSVGMQGNVHGNFNKWLVSRKGKVVAHFSKRVQPQEIEDEILALL